MMLTAAVFQRLVLAMVCVSCRAVPLRNITRSSEEKCCDEETHLEERDRRLTADPESKRSSVFSPDEISSFSTRDDAEDKTLDWNSSPDKPVPQDSVNVTAVAHPYITESSETKGFLQLRREDNASSFSDTTQPAAHLLTSLSDLHQTLDSRPVDVRDVWTEALHLQREEVSVEPSAQDLLTDATMSSEDLPLIFEPFEDITPTGNSALTSRMSVAMAPTAVTVEDPELMVSMDTEHTSSLSGGRLSSWPIKTTEHDGKTEKEAGDDEDDDGTDSDEESEEDLTETTMTPPNRPRYGLIPPPPIWMQGNHGLVRSWVELIREKAGYVSGMLAPVGIGIAGALLLVGALYSIRVIHRRRRENFKHQSRPPREVRSGPDNAMLLADSSEDEF